MTKRGEEIAARIKEMHDSAEAAAAILFLRQERPLLDAERAKLRVLVGLTEPRLIEQFMLLRVNDVELDRMAGLPVNEDEIDPLKDFQAFKNRQTQKVLSQGEVVAVMLQQEFPGQAAPDFFSPTSQGTASPGKSQAAQTLIKLVPLYSLPKQPPSALTS